MVLKGGGQASLWRRQLPDQGFGEALFSEIESGKKQKGVRKGRIATQRKKEGGVLGKTRCMVGADSAGEKKYWGIMGRKRPWETH